MLLLQSIDIPCCLLLPHCCWLIAAASVMLLLLPHCHCLIAALVLLLPLCCCYCLIAADSCLLHCFCRLSCLLVLHPLLLPCNCSCIITACLSRGVLKYYVYILFFCVITVAILAQGTLWAVAVKQAFFASLSSMTRPQLAMMVLIPCIEQVESH